MKYVIAQHRSSGYWLPIVFPEEVTHSLAADALKASCPCNLVSAGFAYKDSVTNEWRVSLDTPSQSLPGLPPREEDLTILRLFLEGGLSGADLNNVLTYLTLQLRKGVEALSGAVKAARKKKKGGGS